MTGKSDDVLLARLRRAKAKLNKLMLEQERLESEIAVVKKEISLLSQLTHQEIPDPKFGGLTNACQIVLRAATSWLTANEIAAGLEDMGYPTAQYKSVAAVVTSTLNRMVEKDLVKVQTTPKPARYRIR